LCIFILNTQVLNEPCTKIQIPTQSFTGKGKVISSYNMKKYEKSWYCPTHS